jgi:hypothetical protein
MYNEGGNKNDLNQSTTTPMKEQKRPTRSREKNVVEREKRKKIKKR